MYDYKTELDKVREFHQVDPEMLGIDEELTVDGLIARYSSMREEWLELEQEFKNLINKLSNGIPVSSKDKALFAKELADLEFVLKGTIVRFKFLKDWGTIFNRVFESNMSKVDPETKGFNYQWKDGYLKVVKGPHYKPAVLEDLVG
jgi:predicted HAD superfamily Cof-like phosphohydrolase